LVWRFRKSGSDGEFTRPFAEWPPEIQAVLNATIEFSGDEVAAVASYRNENQWAVLTTDRLIWADHQGIHQLLGRDISHDTFAPPKVGSTKENLDRLSLTSNGVNHEIYLEPGPLFFGFWNALRMIMP
jgi:hypothetical protein